MKTARADEVVRKGDWEESFYWITLHNKMANKLKEMGDDTAFARKQLEKHGWAEGRQSTE